MNISTTARIETFTVAEFESALRENFPAARHLGMRQGEYVWAIPVVLDETIGVIVRSSIRADGTSAPAGADSIRAWIGSIPDGKPWAPRADTRWTTRRPGWQRRLRKVIEELLALVRHIRQCPTCGAWMKLGRRNGALQLLCDFRTEGETWFDDAGRTLGIPGRRCGTTILVLEAGAESSLNHRTTETEATHA
jgi:hypothetical protein